MKGRISVIIPTYNRAALLPRALDSVLQQTQADLCDIFVVDDGSTDDTPQVLAAYGSRVTCLRQRNRGAGAARNAAIRACHHEFVAFLDSDDRWLPEKVESQLDALARFPEAGFVAGEARGVRPDGTIVPRDWVGLRRDVPLDLGPLLFERNPFATPAMFVRRALLARTGLFRTCLRWAQDYDLWLRMACRAPGILQGRLVAEYALGAQESLSSSSGAQLSAALRALRFARAELRHRPDCRPAWRRGLVRYLNVLRDRAFREHRFAAAARYALESIVAAPRGRARWEWGRLLDAGLRALFASSPRGLVP
ncbi:MAG: glycosyltransferase [Phycisphaerales bacterium]|nr:glycosyltransferase [Phycisphaerales bacterium]